MELEGRTAVVTGAASGIGLAMTERFCAEGMAVMMADVEEARLTESAARVADGGGKVAHTVCDVSDPSQVAALRDRTLEAFGAVHLLCNNAGVANGQTNHRTPPEVWQWVVGVNLLGPAYGVSTFVPLMVEQGEGHVVNTASEAGLCATGFLGPYHPTKYGVVGLSESLSMELAGTGVGVSCLCPELVDTHIFSSTRNAPSHLGLPQPAGAGVSLGELVRAAGRVAMDPADVAAQVAFAVRSNQFWVLTHQVTRARVHHRNQDLELGRQPSSPYLQAAT